MSPADVFFLLLTTMRKTIDFLRTAVCGKGDCIPSTDVFT